MRSIIAACIGVIIASLILMIAQPFGGRVSLPSTYAQQTQIETARQLNPGDVVQAKRDFRLGSSYNFNPPSFYRGRHISYAGRSRGYNVPQGADKQLWLGRYDGLVAAQNMHVGQNLNSNHFMSANSLPSQSNGQKTAVFARDLKAGTILNPTMLTEVEMPMNSQLRGLYVASGNIADKLTTAQGGRVLAVDVKKGMPAMPQLLVKYEDFPYRPSAPVVDRNKVTRAANLLERTAPYSRWGKWQLVWADNLAPGTAIDIDSHVGLVAIASVSGPSTLPVSNEADITAALSSIAGHHTLYSTRKNSPVEITKVGLQP